MIMIILEEVVMMGDSVAYASDSFQLPACLNPACVPLGGAGEG